MRNFSRRGEFKIIDGIEFKQCFICKEYFPYNKNYFFFRSEGWVSSYCKECHTKKRKDRYQKNPLTYILKTAYRALKQRNKKFNIELDFDADYLIELFYSQKSLCAISGLPMTYIVNQGKISTNVSVDRIDSNKGYSKENIQLVQSIVNIMKTDLDQTEFIQLCKNIIDRQSIR